MVICWRNMVIFCQVDSLPQRMRERGRQRDRNLPPPRGRSNRSTNLNRSSPRRLLLIPKAVLLLLLRPPPASHKLPEWNNLAHFRAGTSVGTRTLLLPALWHAKKARPACQSGAYLSLCRVNRLANGRSCALVADRLRLSLTILETRSLSLSLRL